jgi:hypothetical protein
MSIRVHPLAPVIGLDIDGTLGNYHDHFVEFCNNVYYPHGPLSGLSPKWASAKGEFEFALDLSKAEYRAAKLAYRMGGLKRCLPLFEGDKENGIKGEIQHIRSQGIQVWVCTTRPWLSLTTVDPDTQYWLEHNVGPVDGLIYGEDKYLDLIDIVGRRRILGVFDDLPENAERALALGLRAALRRAPHNQWWIDQQNMRGASGQDFWNAQVFTQTKDIVSIATEWKQTHRG